MKSLRTIAILAILAIPAVAQFTEINPGLPRPPYPALAWGDYDNDGDLDVVVAGEGSKDTKITAIYKNTGGAFTNSGIALLGVGRATAAWADFDNDGDLDLAVTGETSNGTTSTRVYRNDGGTFAVVPGNLTGVYAGSIAWGDYDGDGDVDLLITGINSASPGAQAFTKLYRNDAGTFTPVGHPFPNSYLGAVEWGDYDGDGDLDLVMAGALVGGGVMAGIWKNDGSGNFSDAGANLPAGDLGFATWGDYDGDGDLDLLYGGNSVAGWISRVYRNDNGKFVDAEAGLLGVIWSSAAWGDYDNDGDLDTMIIGYDAVAQVNRSILYRNDGGRLQDSGNTFHDADLGTVSWMDYDNDGDLDLLLAGNEAGVGNYLRILRNGTGTPDAAPSTPAGLDAIVQGDSVLLSWGASTDAQTPAAALTYNVRIGTTPGGCEVVASHASSAGYRRLPQRGNAGHSQTLRIRGLKPGTTYHFAVQSVDTAYAGSLFSGEVSFVVTAAAAQSVSFTRESVGYRAIWRGTPGSLYEVETSDDLITWTLLATATAAEGTGLFEITDNPAAAVPQRFYRATVPAVSALNRTVQTAKKITAHAHPRHRR